MAKVHHPDKGGDEHYIKEINCAYEILSDPEKRAKYDKYGLAGLQEDDAKDNRSDLFSMFFGDRADRPRRGADINHTLKVSLGDLYKGKMVKLAITRNVIIGSVKECNNCEATGSINVIRPVSLGYVEQVQMRCDDCRGDGYIFKTSRVREALEVCVERGMKHKQKIVVRNMADMKPNTVPGDLNFILEVKEHPVFTRKGADLLISKKVSLNEALCGFEWKIEHLDGRNLIVRSTPGEVIQPQTADRKRFVKIISGEGMPSHGNPFIRGNLYVMFTVEFPSEGDLDEDVVATLRKLLPKPSSKSDTADLDMDAETTEVVHLDAGDVKDFGKGGITSDSDDEANGNPQPVHCQQS